MLIQKSLKVQKTLHLNKRFRFYTKLHSKHNAAARRRLPGMRRAGIRRIIHTLRKPTTRHAPGKLWPTKLGKEGDLVFAASCCLSACR
ncbi:MAG: hypothetical protein ABFD82_05195 [Syntrophaceae bacterium]